MRVNHEVKKYWIGILVQQKFVLSRLIKRLVASIDKDHRILRNKHANAFLFKSLYAAGYMVENVHVKS